MRAQRWNEVAGVRVGVGAGVRVGVGLGVVWCGVV